jgi:vacuolar-type H+-ATPase subunit I/STV1
MFSGHNIINKSSILFDIFIDHFEKNDKRIKIEFENSCERSKNAVDRKKYIIKIELNLDYISDNMTIELPKIEKHIAPQQIIEIIDYRFDEYIPTIEKKISDIDESIEPMIAKLEKLETNIMELQKQCKSLLERNEELYHLYELSDVDTK